MQHRISLKLAAAAVAAALSAAPALAQNNKGGGGTTVSTAGVITIDQARAEAGGVTPGDAPGFPVTISQPGSYRLMGNLTVSDANTTAIEITSPYVSLDMNGFGIHGPVTCLNVPVVCSGAGIGDGIAVLLNGMNVRSAVTIANGTVRGAGRHGIRTGGGFNDGLRIERMILINNGGSGVSLPLGGVVSDSQLSYNAQHGVTGNVVLLFNNLIRGNGAYGAYVNFASAGSNNLIQGNTNEVNPNSLRNIGPNLCGTSRCP